jgi:proteasome accessory factor C
MSKEMSAPLSRTARLLDLVPYINTHQGIALKDLAKHFDVTPAQMSADLTTLWMCGLPGYTPLELMDLEFDSGYVTIRNAETLAKPRAITFQECVALVLGLDLVMGQFPAERQDLMTSARSLRERIARQLGVPVQLQVTSSVSNEVVLAINKALNQNSGLLIQYHALYKDDVSSRTIKPIYLYELNGQRYLRAYCFSAMDFREFRADRIMQAVHKEVPHGISSHQASEEKIGFGISIKAATRDIAERFGIVDLTENKDFSLTSYSRQWIERSVLASGSGVVVTSPSYIRDSVIKSAQQLLDRYEHS